jgi:hypothetical protein
MTGIEEIEDTTMRYALPVGIMAATGFVLGTAPTAQAEPAGPLPGVYQVFQQSTPLKKFMPTPWVLAADCGRDCLRVFSGGEQPWAMQLHTGDENGVQVWHGTHWDDNGLQCPDPQLAGETHSKPFQAYWVIRPDGTGFVNLPFSPDNLACDGGVEGYNLAVRLVPV